MKKIVSALFVFALLAAVGSSAYAQEVIGKHKEKTPKYGRIYFHLPLAHAMCMEETTFMTEVANLSYLDAFTYRAPLTKSQQAKLAKGESYVVIPDMTKSKEYTATYVKKYMDRIKTVKRRPGRVADTVIAKYNVRDFPSFIYLAPDDKVYKFDIDFCHGDPYRAKFRKILGEFISGKRKPARRWNFGQE